MKHLLVLFIIFFIHQCYSAGIMDHIIFAVNSGGEAHIDSNGIRYRKDYLKSGIASDYGRNSNINRVAREDMIIYQTERYDLQKFSYEIGTWHIEVKIIYEFIQGNYTVRNPCKSIRVWHLHSSQIRHRLMPSKKYILDKHLDEIMRIPEYL